MGIKPEWQGWKGKGSRSLPRTCWFWLEKQVALYSAQHCAQQGASLPSSHGSVPRQTAPAPKTLKSVQPVIAMSSLRMKPWETPSPNLHASHLAASLGCPGKQDVCLETVGAFISAAFFSPKDQHGQPCRQDPLLQKRGAEVEVRPTAAVCARCCDLAPLAGPCIGWASKAPLYPQVGPSTPPESGVFPPPTASMKCPV